MVTIIISTDSQINVIGKYIVRTFLAKVTIFSRLFYLPNACSFIKLQKPRKCMLRKPQGNM